MNLERYPYGVPKDDAGDEYPDFGCLDGPPACAGPVELRSVDGFRWWPRCEAHFDRRLDAQERANELLSDVPAPWFDEGYAGERWDDDY